MNAALALESIHPYTPAAEILRKRMLLAGRNSGPALLHEAYDLDEISFVDMRALLLDVWCLAEFPGLSVPRCEWLDLFEYGFLSDDGSVAPTEAVKVWRAQVGRARGLSWTTDREKAVWFHNRNKLSNRNGFMLEAIAKPEHVLARVTGRGEHELIVHPKCRAWKVQP